MTDRQVIQFLMFMLGTGSASYAAYLMVSSAVFNPYDTSINIEVSLLNNMSSILNLAAFSFELELTSLSSSQVEFDAATQPITLSNPDYVFFGNNADYSTHQPRHRP